MNNIGQRIKLIRKTNNMTQIEFSSAMGIAQGTLSEIEAGKAKPSFDMIYEIKKHFDIDLDWLIMGDIYEEHNSIEYELLQKFRNLDPLIRNEVLEFLEFKILRVKKDK
ncbi:helix-turn-helix transcriptional regulator [Paenibacillus sp. SYP-B3998]|uniref:Helix-turn-helix transcriptional regulator n=1 Tax=Paenibacillus sp. SYP-B3998 TaxID=2678564 RepID=A0A6G4A794_9BACL|nr:helix-turn-helix transcriptional regulator [Paenibacillus sp. SYP-B3998]